MAHPKRQHSRQRQRKRRTHYKTTIPALASCPQCMKPVISHRVCPFCGYYKGNMVIAAETEEKKA